MERMKILFVLAIAVSMLSLSACATKKGSTKLYCETCNPVTIKPHTDESCPSGGTKCSSFCEGEVCDPGVMWNERCTTVYLMGGGCACRCQ